MYTEIRDFLDWKATHAKRASVNYRIWLIRFADSVGGKKLRYVSIQDIVRFQLSLEGKYSPHTVQLAMVAIKGLLKFYRTQGKICVPPELIKTPRSFPRSHRAITEAELALILDTIPATFIGVRDGLIFRLLFDTGLRVSELCALDLNDIDEERQHTTVVTRKNQQRRIIVWSPETHALLVHYVQARKRLSPSPALFISIWGDRLSVRSVEANLKRYVADAGLTVKITPHSFRHGWAHLRRDEGAPLAFIQRGLGHLHPSSTFIYEQYEDNDFLTQAKRYLHGTKTGTTPHSDSEET